MKKFIILCSFLLSFSPLVQAQTTDSENITAKVAKISFAPLIEELTPSVVNISAERQTAEKSTYSGGVTSYNPSLRDYFLLDEGGKTSLGSGFIIDAQGYIVTNHHVVNGADKINVAMQDGKVLSAQLVGGDEATDIALLKVNVDEPLPFAEIGDSDAIKVGDFVLAAGNPFGLGTSFSFGIVSAKSRDIDMGVYDNFIQTDASINQGSSGGPMFDLDGKVIGINTALFSSTGESVGVGFATPANLSKFVISRLMEKGKVERSWIGVQISAQDKTFDISAGEKFSGGVLVTSVTPDSPAQKGGLEAGDVIMALNGRDVKDVKDFSRRIAEMPIGREVIVRLWRSGQSKDFAMQTALRPAQEEFKPAANTEFAEDGYIPNLGIAFDKNEEGVFVRDVLKNSQAAELGIKTGDIIKSVNSHPVTSISDVLSYISYAQSGGEILDLVVISDETEHNISFEVKSTEEPEKNPEELEANDEVISEVEPQ